MAVDIKISPLNVTLVYSIAENEAICDLNFYTLYDVSCYGDRDMEKRAILKRYEDDCTYQFTLKPHEMFTLRVDASSRLFSKLSYPVLHGGTFIFVNGEVEMLSAHNISTNICKGK